MKRILSSLVNMMLISGNLIIIPDAKVIEDTTAFTLDTLDEERDQATANSNTEVQLS